LARPRGGLGHCRPARASRQPQVAPAASAFVAAAGAPPCGRHGEGPRGLDAACWAARTNSAAVNSWLPVVRVRLRLPRPSAPAQVASKRTIALRGTPAGGGLSCVGSTSIYAIGGTEAPATGRRPQASFRVAGPPAVGRLLNLRVCQTSPARSGVLSMWQRASPSRSVARLRARGTLVANPRSISVDGRSQAALNGRPR
jgi:hypothetical protein